MKIFETRISSAVARVRIALALKGLDVEADEVPILGERPRSQSQEYRNVNPQGLVPALLTDDGDLLTQSVAIIEYLEERYPEPPLLPVNLTARAQVRAIAMSIAAELHALITPRVAAHLKTLPGVNSETVASWNQRWILEGLTAVEFLLVRQPGPFCIGDRPSMADILLFPQGVNAERAGIPLAQWPRIEAVMNRLRAIPAFSENAPAARK